MSDFTEWFKYEAVKDFEAWFSKYSNMEASRAHPEWTSAKEAIHCIEDDLPEITEVEEIG